MACNKNSCGGCSCGDKPAVQPKVNSSASIPVNYTFANRPRPSKTSLCSLYPPAKESTEKKYPAKRVIIMRGIPGSGKTHAAKKIKNAVVFSNDDFYSRWVNDYKFDATKVNDASRQCMRNFLRAIEVNQMTIVVDNCNIAAYEVSPYLLVAEANGYEVMILQVMCDPEVAFARQLHGIAKEKIMAMNTAIECAPLPDGWNVEIVEG